jgi:hypothetical protein
MNAAESIRWLVLTVAMFWVRIGLKADPDPDPDFNLNADRGRQTNADRCKSSNQDPGQTLLKLKKVEFYMKINLK